MFESTNTVCSTPSFVIVVKGCLFNLHHEIHKEHKKENIEGKLYELNELWELHELPLPYGGVIFIEIEKTQKLGCREAMRLGASMKSLRSAIKIDRMPQL